MKQKKALLVTPGILLFCLLLITNAFSQVWDNRWFKVMGKARGYIVNEGGDLSRSHFSGTSYIFFQWDSSKQRYNLKHYVQNGGGNWISFNGILPSPVGNNEILWRDIYTRLQDGDNWIWAYAVTRVKIRLDDSNAIEHARFRTMGCESPMGSIDGKNFGGKCKLSGKMIDPEDLPFTP